jgi:hypothetical protein
VRDLEQGLSNTTHTSSGTPATVQWYTGIIRKKSKEEKVKMFSFNKCSYIENLIKLFFV